MHPLRTQAPLTIPITRGLQRSNRTSSATPQLFPHFSAPLTPTYSRELTHHTPSATSLAPRRFDRGRGEEECYLLGWVG